jgi:hypothetical protein
MLNQVLMATICLPFLNTCRVESYVPTPFNGYEYKSIMMIGFVLISILLKSLRPV